MALIDERVHWLRTKARYERGAEEVTKVQHEMQWTVLAFKARATSWAAKAAAASHEGHKAYAGKQLALWKAFSEEAEEKFSHSKHIHLCSHPDWVETLPT